jgi:hypothetical protein
MAISYKIDMVALKRVINNWEATAPVGLLLDINALKEHMLSVNGIKMNPLISNVSAVVVDEKKYTTFY